MNYHHHEHHGTRPWPRVARARSAYAPRRRLRPTLPGLWPGRSRRSRLWARLWPGGPGFGPGFGPRHHDRGGRGGRGGRRGDVRAAVLALLTERPMHGYEMIQELDQRTGGVWRPSPGSVYPTLQLLEDEGLIKSDEGAGRKAYTLTEAGQTEAHRGSRARAVGRLQRRRRWPAGARHTARQIAGIAMALRQIGYERAPTSGGAARSRCSTTPSASSTPSWPMPSSRGGTDYSAVTRRGVRRPARRSPPR